MSQRWAVDTAILEISLTCGLKSLERLEKWLQRFDSPKWALRFCQKYESVHRKRQGAGALRIMNKALGHLRKQCLALSALNYILGMCLLLNLKNFQGYYWQYMNSTLRNPFLPWFTLDLNPSVSHLSLPEVHRGKVNAKIHKLKINSQCRVQSHEVGTVWEFSQCTSWLTYSQLCHLIPGSMR